MPPTTVETNLKLREMVKEGVRRNFHESLEEWRNILNSFCTDNKEMDLLGREDALARITVSGIFIANFFVSLKLKNHIGISTNVAVYIDGFKKDVAKIQ